MKYLLNFTNTHELHAKIWSQAQEYCSIHILSWAMAVQILVAGLALVLARHGAKAVHSWFARRMAQRPLVQEPYEELPVSGTFLRLMGTILYVLIIDIALSMAQHFNWPGEGFRVILILSVGLFFIRFFTGQMRNRFWAKVIAAVIVLWCAGRLTDFRGPLYAFLTGVGLTFGEVHLSLLVVIKASVLLLFLYWLSRNLLTVFRFWLQTGSKLPPAVQTLLEKLLGIFLFSASVVIVLHFMGIDLTVFALFSGALGLGIGFGLQKVIANLVGGLIILADKSIKPGDVIQLGDTYGRINFLGNRYVSVVTRNGTEHLIANEHMITGEVINWSYSNNLVRLMVAHRDLLQLGSAKSDGADAGGRCRHQEGLAEPPACLPPGWLRG